MCLNEVTGRTCNGDSGGFTGVQPEGGNRWVQHGVTSFGIRVSKKTFFFLKMCESKSFFLSLQNCPARNTRMGMTRVCRYVDWIRGFVPDVQIV